MSQGKRRRKCLNVEKYYSSTYPAGYATNSLTVSQSNAALLDTVTPSTRSSLICNKSNIFLLLFINLIQYFIMSYQNKQVLAFKQHQYCENMKIICVIFIQKNKQQ